MGGMGVIRVKGHRLHTESVRGGIIAECSCGQYHTAPYGRTGLWATWDRDKIRKAHQAHLAEAKGEAR